MNFKNTLNARILLTSQSHVLWFLVISYSMALVSANWFDPRLISIFGLNTGAGAIIFPLTYLFSDIITEVYGYKNARLAVWVGFSFNVIFLLYGQLITHLPSPNSHISMAFDGFLHSNMRVILASAASYFITEPLNSYLVAKLKILFSGKFIGFRFIISTISAHLINTMIFCSGAFYGLMSNKHLVYFMLTSWIFMVVIELLLLPLSVRLAKKIKIWENIDIYDKKTKFSIFSLDTNYAAQDNEFSLKKRI